MFSGAGLFLFGGNEEWRSAHLNQLKLWERPFRVSPTGTTISVLQLVQLHGEAPATMAIHQYDRRLQRQITAPQESFDGSNPEGRGRTFLGIFRASGEHPPNGR